MVKLQRAVMTVVAATVLSIGLATSAEAAMPACNGGSGNPNFRGAPWTAQPAYTPAFNSPPNFTCFMNTSTGKSWNDGTNTLQTAISLCYGIPLGNDGYYGPKTAAAVREVQRREGISQDGSYGPQTRAHMLWPTGIYEVDPACARE